MTDTQPDGYGPPDYPEITAGMVMAIIAVLAVLLVAMGLVAVVATMVLR